MPYDDPEPDDPQLLVGVSLPAGEEVVREMACAFAEEFAALGLDEEGIMGLFRRPFYAGAHGAYRALGEETTRRIVAESLAVWGRFRVVVRDAAGDGAAGRGPLRIGRLPSAGAEPGAAEGE